MKYLIAILLLIGSKFAQAQNRRFDNGLNIFVEKNIVVSKNNAYINIIFFNNSGDTILLPTNEFYLKDCLQFSFEPNEVPLKPDCGKTLKKVSKNCLSVRYCGDFEEIEILPFQFRVYRYNLDSCSDSEKGVKYQYQIKLLIEIEGIFKCPNLWQGEIYSELGDFIILKP